MESPNPSESNEGQSQTSSLVSPLERLVTLLLMKTGSHHTQKWRQPPVSLSKSGFNP